MAALPPDTRALRIYFNQVWGTVRTEARSFGIQDGEVTAGTGEQARLPLFGFELPQGSECYPIARWDGPAARLYPPPRAEIERAHRGDAFFAVERGELQADGAGRYLRMEPGTRVRLREGDQVLWVDVDHQRERAGWEKQRAAFWLVFLVIVSLGAPLAFLLSRPDPDLVRRAMAESRVKQGLPAEPLPLELDPVPEDGSSPHGKGLTIPASVR